MFIKQKQLFAKCRACGHSSALDSTHRAGAQLMKQLPKDMSEIEGVDPGAKKTKKDPKEEEKADAPEKKEKKKKEENLD